MNRRGDATDRIDQLVNGELKSIAMPPLRYAVGPETPTLVPGLDVIVGDLPSMAQFGNDTVNHLVGLGVGTTSCNNGDQPFNWFQFQIPTTRLSRKIFIG